MQISLAPIEFLVVMGGIELQSISYIFPQFSGNAAF